ncbi:MAG: hypothetical protein Q9184_007837 [Pyrenodesmia sp. 2 TL-2023]
MQSGYTCQRCLSSLRRAANTTSTVRHVRRTPGYGETGKRHYSPLTKKITPIQVQQRRTAASAESLNHIAVPFGPGAPRYASPFGADEPTERPERVLLKPETLFHSFSNSPAPGIRRRAAFMKSHAYCPHPDHRQTRAVLSPQDPEARKAAKKSTQAPAFVDFECPDCGIPVYCSEKHWMDDYESHSEICDTLRQANEDDHDLHSGRYFPEFRYPGPQIEEILVNMTNWDTYLYTREFNAINEDRSMRQATRMLTYPVTIASIIHELSPYNIRAGGRLTVEGLKSLSGMPLFVTTSIQNEAAEDPMSRVFGSVRRQPGSSSSALALSRLFLVKFGSSSSTSSPAPAYILSSLVPRA